MVRLKVIDPNDDGAFTHRPTGYNTDPTKDRTVYYRGKTVCRLSQDLTGSWYFFGDWAGLAGIVRSQSFEGALSDIKRLHFLIH